jgi:DegV family protein with EDD domain
MSHVAIVADSTCDTPSDWPGRRRLHLVPIHIRFGDGLYREGIDIDEAAFYARVDAEHMIPKTSQPSPGDFADLYRQLSVDYDAVISMHVTGKLSGTYQSAALGAEIVSDTIPVYAFDSGCGSAGLGFMSAEALDLVDNGKSVAETLQRLEHIRSHMNIFLSPSTLKYAVMSGRVSALSSTVASLLNIKPIIVLAQGELLVGERVRTRRRALERMIELLREQVGDAPAHVAIVHARAEADAQYMLEQARQQLNCAMLWMTTLATSVAVHLGPGTIGIVGYPC